MLFINSTFQNLSSKASGGVFKSSINGLIKCQNCEFGNNTSKEGSIFTSSFFGGFECDFCDFWNNFAEQSSIGVSV